MAEGKKSFVLYCDLKHTVDLLDDALAGKLLKHLLRYVNDEEPDTDDLMLKVVFEPIKRQLKRDLVDWNEKREKRKKSGHLGGVKSGESRVKKKNEANEANASNLKQSQANEAVNVNDTVTVNVNTVNSNIQDWDSVKKKWIQDFRWKEKVCRDFGIGMIETEKQMVEFLAGIDLKEDYKTIPALKSHFVNWYKKHKVNGTTSNRGTDTGSAKLGTSDARIEALRKW